MSDDPIDPIDPELGALFGAARGGDNKAPAIAKARAWAKLAAAVGMPTTPTAGRLVGSAAGAGMPTPTVGRPVGSAAGDGMPTVGLFKLLGALAVGAVLGGGAVAALRPPNVVYVDRPVPAASSSETAPAVVGMPTVVRGPEPSAEPGVQPVASGGSGGASSAPAPSASSGSLAAERAVLDEARTALGRGDGQHALDATARHQREFPKGQLVEEREAIAIQALTKLQRCDEATARGHRFEQRYTNSVLGPVVDAALSVCANMKSSAPR